MKLNYDKIISIASVAISVAAAFGIAQLTGLSQWMARDVFHTIIASAAILAIIFLLYFAVIFVLGSLLRKKFREENDAIVLQFQATKDGNEFYGALMNMKNRPRLQGDKNMWHANLSMALFCQGRVEDALRELDEINTESKEWKAFVERDKAEMLKDYRQHISAEAD